MNIPLKADDNALQTKSTLREPVSHVNDNQGKTATKVEATTSSVKSKQSPQQASPQNTSITPVVLDKHASQSDLMRAVTSAFKGQTTQRFPGVAYLCALIFAALGMLVLLFVYFGTIFCLPMGLFYYLTVGVTSMPLNRFTIALHIGIMASGCILLWSLISPLFTFNKYRSKNLVVSSVEEPVLHIFVKRLSEVVGAPVPHEIEISPDVNAAASYCGLTGLLTGRLRLTIGMPLMAGLPLQNLTGVLAHELGHFSQGAGMRLSFFVGTVSNWFGEASSITAQFQMDDDDEMSGLAVLISVVIGLTSLLGTLYFLVLYYISLFLMFFIRRRQEFDADRYEAQVCGSNCFEQTSFQIMCLSNSEIDIIRSLISSPIPADCNSYYDWIAKASQQDRIHLRVKSSLSSEQDSWFNTHPTTRSRIEAAKSYDYPGIFHIKSNSKILLRDYEKTSKAVTPKFFKKLKQAQTNS